MICQECGMKNKSRKCNLCGHVSKRTIPNSESLAETITSTTYRIDTVEPNSKTSENTHSTVMGEASDFHTPKSLKKVRNRIVRVVQVTIAVIMIINVFPTLFYTIFLENIDFENSISTTYHEVLEEYDLLAELDGDLFTNGEKIDSNSTSIYENSQLIKDFISAYIPDKINTTGWDEFDMPLFDTDYEVEAEISCYGGEWYDIYIQLYDVDNAIVDPYLRDLFVDYGGECVEEYEDYGCELWQFSDGISIELYFNEYEGEHYSSMYINNDNWYNYALED